jgi:hypothetical protein
MIHTHTHTRLHQKVLVIRFKYLVHLATLLIARACVSVVHTYSETCLEWNLDRMESCL